MPSTQNYLRIVSDYKYIKVIMSPFSASIEKLKYAEGAVKFAWVYVDGEWRIEYES